MTLAVLSIHCSILDSKWRLEKHHYEPNR